jgi:hypothetical protein
MFYLLSLHCSAMIPKDGTWSTTGVFAVTGRVHRLAQRSDLG